MKAEKLFRFRHLMMFFLFVLALDFYDTYAQNQYGTYGTSRRVARRTSRRTANRVYARNEYYNSGGGYYYEDAPAAPSGGTQSLSGCKPKTINNVEYQYCGGKYYRAYFDGTSVVYVEENP